jgi:glucosamine--fructose-6-phosphate aminotransferase (isomerizing)
MCGIVGYIGPKTATPLLIEGLKRLEYRGYDSAGIATMNGAGLETRKAKGKISMLEAVVEGSPVHGSVGIAHTRWATHGAPNECNAHPHHDCTGTIAVVHNGIIENYGSLRQMLIQQGHTFQSETDTEVLAHLIEAAMDEDSLEDAVIDALHLVEGTYGIAVISSRDPDKIVAARKGSPLLLGLGEN